MTTHDFWSGLIHNFWLEGNRLTIEMPPTEIQKYAVGDCISTARLSSHERVFTVKSITHDTIIAYEVAET